MHRYTVDTGVGTAWRATRRFTATAAALVMLLMVAACGGGGGGGGGGSAAVDLPRAHVQPDRVAAFVGEVYTFDASASSDPNGVIVSYLWDFDYLGGTPDPDFFTASTVVTHSFQVPGTYTVALQVTDDSGKTDLVTLDVYVADISGGVQVVPTSVDFGAPAVGETVVQTIYVLNAGNDPIGITAVNVVNGPETAVPGFDPLAGNLVPAKKSFPITLSFLSTVTERVDDTVRVTTSSGVTLPVSVTGQSLPGFLKAGKMNVARKYHTATLLNSGKVLIVGGVSPDGSGQEVPTESVEIFNPATGEFLPGPPLSLVNNPASGVAVIGPRAFHTATLLPDGRVMVAGGMYEDPVSGQLEVHDTVVIYNPNVNPPLGSWTFNAQLAGPRTQHTATLVGDDATARVVLVGGRSSLKQVQGLATAEEVATNGASLKEIALLSGRVQHAATLLSDGSVLVAGGLSGPDAVRDAERIINVFSANPSSTPTWLAVRRFQHTLNTVEAADGTTLAVAVGGGHVGQSALRQIEAYYPGKDLFVQTGSLIEPRFRHMAVDLGAGRGLLVVGGHDLTNVAIGEAEVIVPDATRSWSAGSPLHTPRAEGHQVTLLDDGTVLVTGGLSGNRSLDSAERYIPAP